jgi:PD-(D/E)XK endonuclease
VGEHVFVFAARPPTDHPVDVGLRSELALANAFVQLGYAVFLPVGHNHRCDLIVEHGERLLRVQCKTGRLRGGVIKFNTVSVRCNRRDAIRRSYDGEVDGFAVWCPQNATGYYVPIEDIASGIATLRVEPTINNQVSGVRWAEGYRLGGGEPGMGLEPTRAVLQERCSTN